MKSSLVMILYMYNFFNHLIEYWTYITWILKEKEMFILRNFILG